MNITEVTADDLEGVIEIDSELSNQSKPDYWHDAYSEYLAHKDNRFFLIAKQDHQILGFIIGEIRAWEFGSPRCGWVFAIGVKKDIRLDGVGTKLLEQLCLHFKESGVDKVRTMAARQDHDLLSFFRSQGMMAGPYLQMEKELD